MSNLIGYTLRKEYNTWKKIVLDRNTQGSTGNGRLKKYKDDSHKKIAKKGKSVVTLEIDKK